MFTAHPLKLSAPGIIYLPYDSTGVLGTDDKKNTYSKVTQEHGFGSGTN